MVSKQQEFCNRCLQFKIHLLQPCQQLHSHIREALTLLVHAAVTHCLVLRADNIPTNNLFYVFEFKKMSLENVKSPGKSCTNGTRFGGG